MKEFKNMGLVVIALLFSVGAWALKPEKKYVEHPSDFKFKYKENTIITADQVKLKSWICYPEAKSDNKITLILAYGDAGNMSYWLRQASELVKAGYTIVLFDYRGFGASQDFAIDENYLYYDEFITDLAAVIQWTKKEVKNECIGVWALSMGSIMATMAIEKNPVDFMIAEGFVMDPFEIVKIIKQYKGDEYKLPANASLYAAALSQLKIPCLFYAGRRDGLTTIDDSMRVKFLNPKSEVIQFNAGHLQGFQSLSSSSHGKKYIDGITAFLAKL